MYKDILVYTGSGVTARRMSEYAATFASIFKARLAGLIVEVDFVDYSAIDRAMTDADKALVVSILLKQRAPVHDAAVRDSIVFENAARHCNVSYNTSFKTCVSADVPAVVTEMARLYDCVLLPSNEEVGGFHIPIIEEVLFNSGRPLIILPTDHDAMCSLGHVIVAWDGSRPATRAVHDALPILREATVVDITTITEEKPLSQLPSGPDLVRHLKAHDIRARYQEVHLGNTPVGEQIMDEALHRGAGLLVMGAYGHSRIRQIVFGGATRTILKKPRLPVMLSL
jgi:nucleotide-binding universal stress UspA family protein